MADARPDFRTCPHCGEELRVKSRERLDAVNRLSLTVSKDGALESARWGLTEPCWDACRTTAYVCEACEAELPEGHQRALDAALENRREAE